MLKEFPSQRKAPDVDTAQVRYMARQVRDSGQLDAMLSDVSDPHLRLEVKRLLLPLLTFTYQEPCRCPPGTGSYITNPPICGTCGKEQR